MPRAKIPWDLISFNSTLSSFDKGPQTEGAEGMGRIWSSWRDNLLRLVKDCKKHEYFSRIIEKPSMDACEVLNLQVNSYMVYSACVTVKQTGLSIDCCEGVN